MWPDTMRALRVRVQARGALVSSRSGMAGVELRHLRSFVAVADERHFGRAAARLGIAQPVVSRHVRTLEDALGAPLLVRTARETRLTDAGAAALPHAREAVAAADRAGHAARDALTGAAGAVTVAFVATTIAAHLPPLVAAMAREHPAVALVTRHMRSADVLPALRRGDVDAALARAQPPDPAIARVPLVAEPVVLAVAEDHPLAARDAVVPEDLAGHALVAIDPAVLQGHPDHGREDLRARGMEPGAVVHAPSVTGALALVAAGAGVFRLPSSAAPPTPGVAYVRVDGSTSVVALYRRAEPPGPALAALEAVATGLGDSDVARDA
jgi:DNA-binding transcriptional LysR family regulator